MTDTSGRRIISGKPPKFE